MLWMTSVVPAPWSPPHPGHRPWGESVLPTRLQIHCGGGTQQVLSQCRGVSSHKKAFPFSLGVS